MRAVLFIPLLVFLGATHSTGAEAAKEQSKEKAWSMNATAIEACSCPDSCPFLFGPNSAAQGPKEGKEKRFCRFNAAYKINTGTWGASKLDGAEFWVFGDRGADSSAGQMDWMVVTFDQATTQHQRAAIFEIVSSLFPVTWNTYRTAVGDIEWVADKHRAYALLDTGKTAEVRLGTSSIKGKAGTEPTVIKNRKYWGATSNNGFVLMPSTLNAVRRGGEKPFEYKGTSGFMITFDIDSKATAPSTGGGGN